MVSRYQPSLLDKIDEFPEMESSNEREVDRLSKQLQNAGLLSGVALDTSKRLANLGQTVRIVTTKEGYMKVVSTDSEPYVFSSAKTEERNDLEESPEVAAAVKRSEDILEKVRAEMEMRDAAPMPVPVPVTTSTTKVEKQAKDMDDDATVFSQISMSTVKTLESVRKAIDEATEYLRKTTEDTKKHIQTSAQNAIDNAAATTERNFNTLVDKLEQDANTVVQVVENEGPLPEFKKMSEYAADKTNEGIDELNASIKRTQDATQAAINDAVAAAENKIKDAQDATKLAIKKAVSATENKIKCIVDKLEDDAHSVMEIVENEGPLADCERITRKAADVTNMKIDQVLGIKNEIVMMPMEVMVKSSKKMQAPKKKVIKCIDDLGADTVEGAKRRAWMKQMSAVENALAKNDDVAADEKVDQDSPAKMNGEEEKELSQDSTPVQNTNIINTVDDLGEDTVEGAKRRAWTKQMSSVENALAKKDGETEELEKSRDSSAKNEEKETNDETSTSDLHTAGSNSPLVNEGAEADVPAPPAAPSDTPSSPTGVNDLTDDGEFIKSNPQAPKQSSWSGCYMCADLTRCN